MRQTMSKGYTLAYYIREIQKHGRRNNSYNELICAVCPRRGRRSVKFRQLCNWLGSRWLDILDGQGKYQGYGRTPKTRVLNVLKFRKRHGFVP